MEDIVCPVYFKQREDDSCVIAYLDYRKNNGLRSNTFVHLALAAFLNGQHITIAKMNPGPEIESATRRRSFRIPAEHPYYDIIKSYPSRLRSEVVRCALRQAIQFGNSNSILSEQEILYQYIKYLDEPQAKSIVNEQKEDVKVSAPTISAIQVQRDMREAESKPKPQDSKVSGKAGTFSGMLWGKRSGGG